MELRVIGCHGGETPRHRTSGFLLRSGKTRIAIDAGCLASGLTLREQASLDAVLVSHGHMDHLKDLATLSDTRCQWRAPPLLIVSIQQTIDILKKHFFNDLLWPNFAKIPSIAHPTIVYQVLKPEVPTPIAGFEVRAIMVHHTIDACAFVVRDPKGRTMAYSGDTGPTKRLWQVLNETPDLTSLLIEVSFPNEQQKLATASGHHTPQTLGIDLLKLARHRDVPTFLYHIKPSFEREVIKQLTKIKNGTDLSILNIGDEFLL
ncbi:MAG: 3',5'-cyclic-nucleotide phosphodiesterase [Polyangiales bacterium]